MKPIRLALLLTLAFAGGFIAAVLIYNADYPNGYAAGLEDGRMECQP